MNMDGFVREYANDRGAVSIDMVVIGDSRSFTVLHMLRRADKSYVASKRRFKSFSEAMHLYNTFVKYLSGDTDELACDMCRYYDKNTRKCSPKNCPHELGGHTFWVMFRDVCKCRGV